MRRARAAQDDLLVVASRSRRRHDLSRLRRARRFYWGRDLAHNAHRKMLGKALHTPTPCSCWMCGNPRRFAGERTYQERRFLASPENRLLDQDEPQ